jgi:hypothetical protein
MTPPHKQPERVSRQDYRLAGWLGSAENSGMSDHGDRNHEGLERLRRLTSLSDAELATDTGNEWTVATVLGHMAFFDRMLLLRWDTYEKDRTFAELTPNHFVERIDALPEAAVAVALGSNRVALLERMLHWYPHLAQVETAIGREI